MNKREQTLERARVTTLLDSVVALDLRRNGTVAMLVEKPSPGQHERRNAVQVLPGKGLTGDHPRKAFYRGKEIPGREVSAVSLDVLRVLGVDPMVVGDNLVTEGIDLAALRPGDCVRAGEVLLERSDRQHRPCRLFQERTSKEAYAVALRGYRGALFIVREGGTIREGESINVEMPA